MDIKIKRLMRKKAKIKKNEILGDRRIKTWVMIKQRHLRNS
jgi:hypothetical protein